LAMSCSLVAFTDCSLVALPALFIMCVMSMLLDEKGARMGNCSN
jgi:hypothetical protein